VDFGLMFVCSKTIGGVGEKEKGLCASTRLQFQYTVFIF